MPTIDFTGQVAIVTGAGSGIGEATALALAGRGAALLINDPAPGLAEAVAGEIRARGGRAEAETSAVGSPEAARRIVEAALAAFGRVDVLVNNAGIARPGAFGEVSTEAVESVLAVNLLGPYALMQAAWPVMRGQGYGRVVNTSSSAALGSGISGPYAASKAGLIGLTKDAAIAGEPLGIRVNAIMPAAHTRLLDKHPDANLRRWMAEHMPPDRVAVLTTYLASRAAAVTGELFTAGGGRVSRVAFIESEGIFDPQLTPEALGSRLDEVSDMGAGKLLRRQVDHQAAYARIFPDYPLES